MHSLDYQSPASESRGIRLTGYDALIALAFVLLSALSFWVVYRGASDEPYAGPIRMADGVVQVGVGCMLIFAWILLAGLIAGLVLTRRAFALWLIAPLWGLICCFYLAFGLYGYMADLQRYHQPVWPAQQGASTP